MSGCHWCSAVIFSLCVRPALTARLWHLPTTAAACRAVCFQLIYKTNYNEIFVSHRRHLPSGFDIETEDGKIKDVQFYGGCNGNLQGICSLIKGMPIGDVIGKLHGIRCGSKPTSCPDQLSRALSLIVEKEGNGEK